MMRQVQAIVIAVLLGCALVQAASRQQTIAKILAGPKYVTQVDSTKWYPPTEVAASMCVPGLAPQTSQNVVNLAFWRSGYTPDAAGMWANAQTYLNDPVLGGTDGNAIRKNIIDRFHNAGKLLMVSAFGDGGNPTGSDPTATCTSLAQFVINNNLDGADCDFEDGSSLESGTGEAWLITCTKTLRQYLPKGQYIVTHAPQAPQFTGTHVYKNGAYQKVHQQVGEEIDWQNIQYQNQGENSQDTYEQLFTKSGGQFSSTSIAELRAMGIPHSKIVIGKPATRADAANTGTVNAEDLATWSRRAKSELKWAGGFMTWQYSHDYTGAFINKVAAALFTSKNLRK